MIPLLSGPLPAQNATQSSASGSGESGSAFGDLFASMMPAGREPQGNTEGQSGESEAPGAGAEFHVATVSEATADQQVMSRFTVPVLGLGQAAPEQGEPAPVEPELTAAPAVEPTVAETSGEWGATTDSLAQAVRATDPNAAKAAAAATPLAAASPTADDSTVTGQVFGTDSGTIKLPGIAPAKAQALVHEEATQIPDNGESESAEQALQPPAESSGPIATAGAASTLVTPDADKQSGATPAPTAVPVHPAPPQAAAVQEEPSAAAAVAGVGTITAAKPLAVENVVAREPQAVPLNRQLLGPISVLAAGPHGDRTLSVNIAPEALGPVTVKAHLGLEGLRVELTAPTEAGREALRAMLPELRRDLAAAGAGSVSVSTADQPGTGAGNQPDGERAAANEQRFAAGTPARSPQGLQKGAESVNRSMAALPGGAQNSSHLDVMA